LYILECVCRLYREERKNGRTIVPVSVNFSRLDFDLCDIVQEMEQIIARYSVPREQLHVEITESVFARKCDIESIIKKFRALGYSIWMDDFGSEYSSFNVLKDIDFDVIKIDMGFLSEFNEKTRDILMSIVNMAKVIGSRTLTEGVEGKEQFEYLRRIGCEMIQGYYFSVPRPYKELVSYLDKKNVQQESVKDRVYNETIGRVNVLSPNPFMQVRGKSHLGELPLAIVEYEKGGWSYLYANEPFRKDIQKLGTNIDLYKEYVSPRLMRPLIMKMREGFERTLISSEEAFNYVAEGNFFRFHTKLIAEQDTRKTILVSVSDIGTDSAETRRDRLDSALKQIYSIFEAVIQLDVPNNSINNLYVDADSHAYHLLESTGLHDAIEKFGREHVYWEDQERFRQMLDDKTLLERLANSSLGFINSYFRTRDVHGYYKWRLYTIIYQDGGSALMMVRRSNPDLANGWYQRRFGKASDGSGYGSEKKLSGGILWENLLRSHTLGFFWKDAERKFAGVNRRFLEYYGFDSDSEVLGKTDEEMGWHINHEASVRDENAVLNEGVHISRMPGSCIVNGQNRTILTSKMPVYDNGDIVGLLGYFMDAESEAKSRDYKNLHQLQTHDHVTGLLNMFGLLEVVQACRDEYVMSRRDFALIHVKLDNLYQLCDDYGAVFGSSVLRTVGEVMQSLLGHNAVIGRPGGEEFNVVKQFVELEEITELVNRINSTLRRTIDVSHRPVTLYFSIGYGVYSTTKDVDSLLQNAREMANIG